MISKLNLEIMIKQGIKNQFVQLHLVFPNTKDADLGACISGFSMCTRLSERTTVSLCAVLKKIEHFLPVFFVTSLLCYQSSLLPVFFVTSLLCYQSSLLPVFFVTSLLCYQSSFLKTCNMEEQLRTLHNLYSQFINCYISSNAELFSVWNAWVKLPKSNQL